MGMFDTIYSEYPLPIPENIGELTNTQIQNAHYQTKDIDNILGTFKICSDGFLWRKLVDGYYDKGDPEAESIVDRLPRFVKVSESWMKTELTCYVNFYVDFKYLECSQTELNNDYWLEYRAHFYRGKLSDILISKFEVEDNTERRTREANWKKQHQDRIIFLNKWYIKSWYVPWRWVVSRIFRLYRKVKNHIPNEWKVEKFLLPW